jgi:transposase
MCCEEFLFARRGFDHFWEIDPSVLSLRPWYIIAAWTAYYKDRPNSRLAEVAHTRRHNTSFRSPLLLSFSEIVMKPIRDVEVVGVGIDTARYHHHVAFLDQNLRPVAKSFYFSENQNGYNVLLDCINRIRAQYPRARLVVRIDEAGQYARNLESFLRSIDPSMTVSIGDPVRNKHYHKAHYPKSVSDKTESSAMARYAVVEVVENSPASSPQMLVLREVAGRLHALSKQLTRTQNRLHNQLARTFPEIESVYPDICAGFVLKLLRLYPTPERIVAAKIDELSKIPFLTVEKAVAVQNAAQRSVGSLSGPVAEELVRRAVADVEFAIASVKGARDLLEKAFKDLPIGAYNHVVTIPGVGPMTAAVLVAKIENIDRFKSPEALVNYFGIFPERAESGTDKQGRPNRQEAAHMSRKGNDLVRHLLWNAARAAITHNPACRALYARQIARGKRFDVSMGHCMRKLLHLVYAVWKTNRPWDDNHFPWADPTSAKTSESNPPEPIDARATSAKTSESKEPESIDARATSKASVDPTASLEIDQPEVERRASSKPRPSKNKKTASHNRDEPDKKVVTTVETNVASAEGSVKKKRGRVEPKPPFIDYEYLRSQINISDILDHLRLKTGMRVRGGVMRGPCPVHGDASKGGRTFSVDLDKNIYQCFDSGCGSKGNVLDLWAAIQRLPLYEAASLLARTFGLALNREEEPVPRSRPSRP